MRVLVDTSVWSTALRRKNPTEEEGRVADTLSSLLRDLRVIMIGPIRQEILSGIRDETRFFAIRDKLRALPDEPLSTIVYEEAARYHTLCRRNGIQGSQVDFLIAAAAVTFDVCVYTLDKDFAEYAKILPVRLYAL